MSTGSVPSASYTSTVALYQSKLNKPPRYKNTDPYDASVDRKHTIYSIYCAQDTELLRSGKTRTKYYKVKQKQLQTFQ